uniref:Uncharacterized protein n=1 Tax=Anguilla anguilla TaxID=7936 RepID=A0A0E9QAV5_ANGAN
MYQFKGSASSKLLLHLLTCFSMCLSTFDIKCKHALCTPCSTLNS